MSTNRPLRVFLCHSSNDKPAVRELYQQLRAQPWLQPWLDEEELFPGADWNFEIENAVEASDAILVFLTKGSITKEGYVQRELRIVLDLADYKPEGTLFIIPVRLEDCEPPRRLRKWQFANYFEGQHEQAFQRLLVSLRRRADSLGLDPEKFGSPENETPLSNKSATAKDLQPKAPLGQTPETAESTKTALDDSSWRELLKQWGGNTPKSKQRTFEKTDFESLGILPPIAQEITTYVMGDDLYDESYSIDTAVGEYRGEFGVGLSDTIGTGTPKKVNALEVWLFDKNDIKMQAKVLLSDFAFGDTTIRSRLESKGELIQIEANRQILLETSSLQLLVTVFEIKYAKSSFKENSIFERVTLEFAAWPRGEQDDTPAGLESLAGRWVRKSGQAPSEPEKAAAPDYGSLRLGPPVTQARTTYVRGDDLYDESFSIDTAAGEFLGEFGVGIAEASGVGSPKNVVALEAWIFDKDDIRTQTKVLISEFALNDPAIGRRLEYKGDLVEAQPGVQVLFETAKLQMLVKIIEVKYTKGSFRDKSTFDLITLEFAVWPLK